jgi:hypothetical protein
VVKRALNVIRLTCARCGETLQGLESDVVFFCSLCAVGYEVSEEGLTSFPLQYAKADKEKRGMPLYLPFWYFRFQAEPVCDDRRKLDAIRPLLHMDRAFVKGFALTHSFYIGNPGLRLTEARYEPRLLEASAPYPPITGCRRSSGDAERYVRLFVLALLDREEDVTGVDMEVRITDCRLLGIPFFDGGRYLQGGILDDRYPAAAVSDLGAMREAVKSRGAGGSS